MKKMKLYKNEFKKKDFNDFDDVLNDLFLIVMMNESYDVLWSWILVYENVFSYENVLSLVFLLSLIQQLMMMEMNVYVYVLFSLYIIQETIIH